MSHFIDYENLLNPDQLAAVTNDGGPVLVIAGAGSGKTRTIVFRVAWLVEKGVDPGSILLLTFTRKASEEMLSRAAELLQRRISAISGGTFHSTGNYLLRRYAGLLGFESSFSIMDQGDSIEALDHIRSAVIEGLENPKLFPKSRTLVEIIGRSHGTGDSIEDVLTARYPHFSEYLDLIMKIGGIYERHKLENNLVDYDDLLGHTVRLLEQHEKIREEISERWQYILVDEYQDTNRLQARMVRLLASAHDNVMVVGDDSQSIYSFRGADFNNIMEFPKLFPGTKIIKLEENYRSTSPVLALTNRIIASAAVGFPKRLYTRRQGGPLPLFARAASEREQSQFVVKCIRELMGHGIPLNEIAVLFRAGFHSFELEGELNRNLIPFVKFGGMKFMESQHIKDALAYLKVLNNSKDRLSWIRILKILPGIGQKTAGKLAGEFAHESIHKKVGSVSKSAKYRSALEQLSALITELEDTPQISVKLDKIIKYFFPFLQERYDNYPKRMRDLEQLADMAASYKSLNLFLSDIALEPPDAEGTDPERSDNKLVLSTIHSSKGLEWHTVILIWAIEGRIPSKVALVSGEDMEEERRLVYVATTRAKHNLVIVSPQMLLDRRLGFLPTKVSRFLADIPPEYFRTVQS